MTVQKFKNSLALSWSEIRKNISHCGGLSDLKFAWKLSFYIYNLFELYFDAVAALKEQKIFSNDRQNYIEQKQKFLAVFRFSFSTKATRNMIII